MNVNLNKNRFFNSPIYKILNEFDWISDDLLAVGGCVRDMLIEKEYDDVDITSSTTPDEVIQLAEQNGYDVYETGVEHGTVTLMSKESGELVEHTTFRKDVSTDGRRATVEFAKSFKEDARRRDFTINSMGININGQIFDYFHGINDLEQGILDFVGNSEDRLNEDALRALRAFRFACRFDLEIQPDDFYLIRKTFENNFVGNVSMERVFMEIEKAMKQLDLGGWYRFITYLSFHVIPFVFDIKMNGYDVRRKISHPSVIDSMEFDAFIHSLLWDFKDRDSMNKFPLTVNQKRRMKFSKDLSEKSLLEAVWNHRNVIRDTDVFQKKWFIKFLGFDFDKVVNALNKSLDSEWPSELKGKEIGEWQKHLFESKINQLDI